MHSARINSFLHGPTNLMSKAHEPLKREDSALQRDIVASIACKPPVDAIKELETWMQKASSFDVSNQYTRIVDLFFGDSRELNIILINRRDTPRNFEALRQFLEPCGFFFNQLERLSEFTFEFHSKLHRNDFNTAMADNRENLAKSTGSVNRQTLSYDDRRHQAVDTRRLSALAYFAMRFCDAASLLSDIEFENLRSCNSVPKRNDDESMTDLLYVTLFSDYLTFTLPTAITSEDSKVNERHGLPILPLSSAATATVAANANRNRSKKLLEPLAALGQSSLLTDSFVRAIFSCWLSLSDSNSSPKRVAAAPYAYPSPLSNCNAFSTTRQSPSQLGAFALLCLRMFVRQFHFWRNAALRRSSTGVNMGVDLRFVASLYDDVRRYLAVLFANQLDALRKGTCAAPHFDARFIQLVELLLSYLRPYKFDSAATESRPNTGTLSMVHKTECSSVLNGANTAQADESWRVSTYERFIEENLEFFVPLLATAIRVLRVRADCGLNVCHAVHTLRRLISGLYTAPSNNRRRQTVSCSNAFYEALKRKLTSEPTVASWQPNLESTTCYSPMRSTSISRPSLSPSASPGWSPSGPAWTSFGPLESNSSRAELEAAIRDCAGVNLVLQAQVDSVRPLFGARSRDSARSTRDELLSSLRTVVEFFKLPSDTVVYDDKCKNGAGNDSHSRSSNESDQLEPASTYLNRRPLITGAFGFMKQSANKPEPKPPAVEKEVGEEIVFNRFRRFRRIESTVPKRDRLVSQSENAALVHFFRSLSSRINTSLTERYGAELAQLVEHDADSGHRDFVYWLLRQVLSRMTLVTTSPRDTGRLLHDSTADLETRVQVRVEFDIDLRFLASYRTWYYALLVVLVLCVYCSLNPAASLFSFLVYWLIRLIALFILCRGLLNILRSSSRS